MPPQVPRNRGKEFRAAFHASLPVLMGYGVLGFSFGLLAVSEGLAWYWPVLMSLVIYAGALQFLAVGMLKAKAGFLDLFIASIVVNIRQVFYGLSLLKRFKKTGRRKPYLVFALTDETYALLTTIPPDPRLKRRLYVLYLSLLNHAYWVLGTLAGALFAVNVRFDTRGMDFALTALFVVLALEQYKARRCLLPFAIGALVSIVSLLLVPMERMLLLSIALALAGMFLMRRRLEHG